MRADEREIPAPTRRSVIASSRNGSADPATRGPSCRRRRRTRSELRATSRLTLLRSKSFPWHPLVPLLLVCSELPASRRLRAIEIRPCTLASPKCLRSARPVPGFLALVMGPSPSHDEGETNRGTPSIGLWFSRGSSRERLLLQRPRLAPWMLPDSRERELMVDHGPARPMHALTATTANSEIERSGCSCFWLIVTLRSCLHGRGRVDLVDGLRQRCVERRVAHRSPQLLEQRARETGDQPVVPCQALAGIGTAVAARQGDDANHPLMGDKVLVEVRNVRDRQLQHHLLIRRQRIEVPGQRILQESLGVRLVGALDEHLRLKNRNQAVLRDLCADLELLLGDRCDTAFG